MVVKTMETKIKEKAKILIVAGNSKDQAVHKLKNEFSKVAERDIIALYKKAQGEQDKFNKKQGNSNKPKNKARTEDLKASQVNTSKTETKQAESKLDKQKEGIKDMFKVKSKIIEFEGEKHVYKKNGNVLLAGEERFESLEDIEKYRKEQLKEFEAEMEELKAAYVYEG